MTASFDRCCASIDLRRASYSLRVRAVSWIPARAASEEEEVRVKPSLAAVESPTHARLSLRPAPAGQLSFGPVPPRPLRLGGTPASFSLDEGFNDWGGRGYDDSVPGKSPKQPLPRIGLHDALHGRQACPEFIDLTRGLGKYVPSRSYFRAVPSPNGDKLVISPPPPIVERVGCLGQGYPRLRQSAVGGGGSASAYIEGSRWQRGVASS